MTNLELIPVFLIGFFGGFGHCLGMCGGFVLAYSTKLSLAQPPSNILYTKKIAPHFLYNAGRICTYMLMATTFTLISHQVIRYTGFARLQSLIQVLAGVVMCVLSLEMMGLLKKLKQIEIPAYNRVVQFMGRKLGQVTPKNIFFLGMILGLIPCGMVYAVLVKAVATGSLMSAALTMLVFGIGTFPALFFAGYFSHLLNHKYRAYIYKAAGLLILILGAMATVKGLQGLLGMAPHHGMHVH